jgi:hypothetical protein
VEAHKFVRYFAKSPNATRPSPILDGVCAFFHGSKELLGLRAGFVRRQATMFTD